VGEIPRQYQGQLAEKEEVVDPRLVVTGAGPFAMPWERRRRQVSLAEAKEMLTVACCEESPHECPMCGNVMSHREWDEQRICNQCHEGTTGSSTYIRGWLQRKRKEK